MTRVLAVFAAAALLLSGCAGGAGEYPAATATALQQHVLAVSDAASDGDAEAALTRLDELATSAKTALARGSLTEERGESILSAIELVRADLEAMLDEQAGDGDDDSDADGDAPAEEPADTGSSGSGGSGGSGNSGDNGNSGEGNSGNGNGNGNGGSDEETEAPVDEEPVEEEPTPEPTEPVEEPTAPPTAAPPAPKPTPKPTEAPSTTGEEVDE